MQSQFMVFFSKKGVAFFFVWCYTKEHRVSTRYKRVLTKDKKNNNSNIFRR
mgnify:CR=1 FL=1